MLEFFNVPAASSVVTNSTDYASTLTTSFIVLVWVVLGVTAAVVIVKFLKKTIGKGLRGAAGMGGRRGRRRR